MASSPAACLLDESYGLQTRAAEPMTSQHLDGARQVAQVAVDEGHVEEGLAHVGVPHPEGLLPDPDRPRVELQRLLVFLQLAHHDRQVVERRRRVR